MLASRLPLAFAPGFLAALATFWLLWAAVNVPVQILVHRPVGGVHLVWRSEQNWVPRGAEEFRAELDIPETPGVPTLVVDPPAPPARGTPAPIETIDDLPLLPGPRGFPVHSDREAMPRIRVAPRWPSPELARHHAGWVLVEFSVTASGAVTDVRVVDSDPPGVFDRTTVEAVRQWRYWPRIVDGEPVNTVGLRTVVRYEPADGQEKRRLSR